MSAGSIPGVTYQRLAVRDGLDRLGLTGNGPPALFLHGFPQTHWCWRSIVPVMSERLTVVVTDLRGYGASSAPAGGPEGEGYSKRDLAANS